MNHLLLIFDSVRYDVFMKSSAVNLKRIAPCRLGLSHGSWTIPSMASVLMGYLPQSSYGQPFQPYYLFDQFKNRGYTTFLLDSNGLLSFFRSSKGLDNYIFFNEIEKLINYLNELLGKEMVFVLAFFSSTHISYGDRSLDLLIHRFNQGEDISGLTERAMDAQIKAINETDKKLESILDRKGLQIYFFSDHGELFGENHCLGHNPKFPFHPALLQVPVAVGRL